MTLPVADQRGILRGPAFDVGAYQVGYGYLVTNTADSYAQGTLRSAVAWANLDQAPTGTVNTILFDIANVFSTAQTITLLTGPDLGTLELTNTTTPISIDYTGSTSVTITSAGVFGDFLIDSGVTAIFTALTIAGGSAGGRRCRQQWHTDSRTESHHRQHRGCRRRYLQRRDAACYQHHLQRQPVSLGWRHL